MSIRGSPAGGTASDMETQITGNAGQLRPINDERRAPNREWCDLANRKFLIVHADDLGLAHSVNAAATKAFELGAATSGSVMVPCPWFPEVAAYGRCHAGIDLGVHLTLTSERSNYRWGPVASKDRVPSLLDESGYFHKSPADAIEKLDPDQAETEMRAQIERAFAFGIRPTHLDSHQFVHYSSPALFALLSRLGREYGIPVFLSRSLLVRFPHISTSGATAPALERVISIGSDIHPLQWESYYLTTVGSVPVGINQLIVHPAYDDSEMRAATSDRPTWGAAWRQRDFDFITGNPFQKLLQSNAIQLTSWGQIARCLPRHS